LGNDCAFDTVLHVLAPAGGYVISTICPSTPITVLGTYEVDNNLGTALVEVTLNCFNPMVDCLGVPGGNALPGTPCPMPNVNLMGIWTADCVCEPDPSTLDCLGIPFGPNQPGTPCPSPVAGLNAFWNSDCVCEVDSGYVDCLGIPGGPALPGTPCPSPIANLPAIWTSDCECVPVQVPCQAGFWVLQAYEPSSTPSNTGTPIPFELWVLNLSTGVSPFQFLWNFGDGTTSTEAFPTHTYPGPGPYLLCLTIADATGCTSTHCDTIQVDEDGMLGMITAPEVRSQLRINVIQSLPTGTADTPVLAGTRLWPNPVNERFSLMLHSNRSGVVEMSIIDLEGREVQRDGVALQSGMNAVDVEVNALQRGMYLLRLQHGQAFSVLRFVKE
jgi:hypothetical protein